MPLLPMAPLLTNDNIGTHLMCTPCKNAVQCYVLEHYFIKTNIYKYGCYFYTILVLQAHILLHILHITLHPHDY